MKTSGLDGRITALVQSGLSGVEKVYVVETIDRDGDPIVRVTVVVRKDVSIDNDQKVALVNELREELMSEQMGAFPILSFMSSADGVKFKREFA